MNAKEVLNKIMNTLSLVREEVIFTQAQSADGTILDSKTFDVNEAINEVSEDGTLTPAKDGEYEVVLKDAEGKDEKVKVVVKDGKIAERENVELESTSEEIAKDEVAMDSMAGDDIAAPTSPNSDTEEVQPIPQTLSEAWEKLSNRIAELEKLVKESVTSNPPKPEIDELVKQDLIDSTKPAEKVEVGHNSSEMSKVDPLENDDEDELPKLDGAPIEEPATKLGKTNYGKKLVDSQASFLSKLYK